MAYFLWPALAIALVVLGVWWVRKKTSFSGYNTHWPTPAWNKKALEDKLLLADPWEVADWVVGRFASKDELWPELKEVLKKSGLEGVLIAGLSSEPKQQVLAAKALGLIGGPKSLPALVKALGSKDEVSLEAMEAIKKLKRPESGPLLLDALVTGKGAVPSRCAHILISLGNLVQECILKTLPQVSDPAKAVFIEILGEMKQKELLTLLAPYLKSSNSLIRQKTVQALGTIGSSSACTLLIPLLADEDWKVRAETAKVLGLLGCMEAVHGLKKLCADPSWHVQVNAREALEELGVSLED